MNAARSRNFTIANQGDLAAVLANGFDSVVIKAASMPGRGRVRRLLPYHSLCDPAPPGRDAKVARRVVRECRFITGVSDSEATGGLGRCAS